MDPTIIFITTIVKIVTEYGIPVARDIISTWKSDGIPTEEDIIKLADLVKNPSSYFEDETKLSSAAPVNVSPQVKQVNKFLELLTDEDIGKISITFELNKDK